MKSRKVEIKQKLFLLCTILSISVCACFPYDSSLPDSALFEPADFDTIASVENKPTIRPPADVPTFESINSFFAPVDSAEEIPLTEIQTANADINPFDSLSNVIPPSEYKKPKIKVQSAETRGESDQFSIMNTITLPSQYKKTMKQTSSTKETIKNLPDNFAPNALPTHNASYVSSAIEDYVPPEIDFEGKTISQIRFSGLNKVSENDLSIVINTKEGAEYNFERLQNDLQKIYELGYFKDNMYIEPEELNNGTAAITFVLEENMLVKDVEFQGNSAISSPELIMLVKDLEGRPQNLNLINEKIELLNDYYKDKGYILAKVSNVDDSADGKLIFTMSEGIIEKINFEGNTKTKDFVIRRNILTKEGSVYNEEVFKKDLSKVYSTQIFEKVDRKIEPVPGKDGEYIVTVEVKEASSNNVSIGLGLDNALGGFGSVSFNEKNFLGRNQKLSLSGMLGSGLLLSDSSIKNRMNWNVELNFFEPYFFNENNTFASKAYYRDLGSFQIPLAIERRWGITNTIEHKVRSYDNLSTSFAFGYENIHLKEGDYAKISQIYRQSNVDISKRADQLKGGGYINFTPGIKYSTLDDENMPRDGWIAKVGFNEALGLTSTKRTNGRLMGSVTKYIPVLKKSTLLVGAKGGLKVHGHDMPEVMAFRLGGPYTIRGFKMNGVGSGESFVMASTELQTPLPFTDRCKFDIIKNLRFAFFVDAGRVFEPTLTSTLYDRPLSAISVGVGLRVNIPGMHTISVDYGLPLTHTGRYTSQHGYFTFGTGGLYDSY